MFDLKRTLQLVRGALLEPEPTWRTYLPEAADWKRTAFLLTGPLIVASAVVAYLLGFIGDGGSIFGWGRPTLALTLLQMLMGAVTIAVAALILSALAGAFRGKSSFALALAAASLAFVPGYLGQALSVLPWIGLLLGLGLFIWSLVLLWRIIPLYLEVPDTSRAGHYIASLLAIIVANFAIMSVVGRMVYDTAAPDLASWSGEEAPGAVRGGVLGAAMRQAELMAMAEEDLYEPPSDGKLREQQVQSFIRVMERATEVRAQQDQRLQEIAQKAEQEEQISMSDFGQMMGGIASFAGLESAEMEVVKTGGGNWAEHRWVRDSLRTAWIQKDLNDAVAHNYRLYQKYEDDLAAHIAR